MSNLLLVSVLLPLLGAIALVLLPSTARDAARWLAATASGLTAVLAIAVCYNFSQEPPGVGQFFAPIDYDWLGRATGLDIRFTLGLDGLGIWMFGLSSLLTFTAVLMSWNSISDRAPMFYAMLLLLECGSLGVFSARDIILFYVFFEFTLIPLFFLIGIWGSEDRRWAAIKFFLFTLAGSLLTFLGLLTLVLWVYSHKLESTGAASMTFNIAELTNYLSQHPMPGKLQLVIFLALWAGFAIKVPLFPLHTWLPLAHVQAPAAGSIMLAGVLLKIGTYGFVRFSIPMLPEATAVCMPWLLWLAVAGIIYGALVALAQTDMKRLIAYSSVSHMGFVMLGLFALNKLGVQGAVLQMVNHGISTGALFAIVGMIYERYHTRKIRDLGGLARRMPIMAFFMLLFTFSSIGVPFLNGFAGELLILVGMFQRGFMESPNIWGGQLRIVSVLSLTGVILGAWYMLWLVQHVFFGPLKEPAEHGDGHHGSGHHAVPDLSSREILALTPLAVLVVWIGLWPGFFLKPASPALDRAVQASEKSLHYIYSVKPQTANAPQMETSSRGD